MSLDLSFPSMQSATWASVCHEPIPPRFGVERGVLFMAADRPGYHTIVLDGPATIYEVAGLRDVLRDAIAGGGHLQVDLAETGKWDLAGVQLLVSLVQSGRRQ